MLPIIIGAAALLAGAAGVGAAIEAKDKLDEAERIVKDAQRRYNKAKEELDSRILELNSIISEGGDLYYQSLELLEDSVKFYREVSQKQAVINIRTFKEVKIENLLSDIQRYSNSIRSLKLNSGLPETAVKTLLTGGLSYIGAISLAEAIGTASTGTAIASLSGAAYTNALLAWFGGGAVAVGGGGIALGTLVLGGIIAGPAIAIGGFTLLKNAEKALTEAKEYEYKVDKAIAEIRKSLLKIDCLNKQAKSNIKIIEEFKNNLLNKLYILSKKYYSYQQTLNIDELKTFVILMKNLKEAIDKPLIDFRKCGVKL